MFHLFYKIGQNLKNKPKISPKAKQKIYQESISDCKLFSKVELKKLKQKNFIDRRAYVAVRDYLAPLRRSDSEARGKFFSLSVLREVMK